MKNMKTGFTLVEVLIVVIIIAVLASLMIPRMTGQSEKAKCSEALQMMGAIKRASERRFDFHGSFNIPGATSINQLPGVYNASWKYLGLQGLENSKDWKYYYTVGGTGTAYKFYAQYLPSPATTVYYSSPGLWTCNGIFQYIDTADKTKGCRT